MLGRNFSILSISYVDVLNINNIYKTLYISNIDKSYILNIDINVVFLPHVEKLPLPHMEKCF